MSDAALAEAGIGPGTYPLSIGLEDPEDLIEDLGRGLRAAEGLKNGASGRGPLRYAYTAGGFRWQAPGSGVHPRRRTGHSVWALQSRYLATTVTRARWSICRATAGAAARRLRASRTWRAGSSLRSTRPRSARGPGRHSMGSSPHSSALHGIRSAVTASPCSEPPFDARVARSPPRRRSTRNPTPPAMDQRLSHPPTPLPEQSGAGILGDRREPAADAAQKRGCCTPTSRLRRIQGRIRARCAGGKCPALFLLARAMQ